MAASFSSPILGSSVVLVKGTTSLTTGLGDFEMYAASELQMHLTNPFTSKCPETTMWTNGQELA